MAAVRTRGCARGEYDPVRRELRQSALGRPRRKIGRYRAGHQDRSRAALQLSVRGRSAGADGAEEAAMSLRSMRSHPVLSVEELGRLNAPIEEASGLPPH